MAIATQSKDGLDSLLRSSASCLSKIKAGCLEDMDKVLARHDMLLRHYMQGNNITNMERPEQDKLYQLLADQKAAIKIIREQKQQLVNKLTELRKGRSLKATYRSTSWCSTDLS